MDDRDINKIRETIAKAKAHEQSTSLLANQFGQNIERLHTAIELPDDNKVEALMNFVIHYIEHVPDFIEAISNITHQAGIDNYSETFIAIAKDYFLKPPEAVSTNEHSGLLGLMDEAYLAHRLIEEINDRLIGQIGIPLAPMDMTRSNIIIHHLIGEPFANELDMAVHYSVESLMPKEKVFQSDNFLAYINEHKKRGWSSELERWPCLANDLSITLRFEDKGPQPSSGPFIH
jgi:hypothetical protein